ncbi:MAG: hypothetical protein QXZ70_09190 [Candidatus Bathyarchaeia archaeon]
MVLDVVQPDFEEQLRFEHEVVTGAELFENDLDNVCQGCKYTSWVHSREEDDISSLFFSFLN